VSELCVWFEELTRSDIPLAGGKGANLGEMVRAGLPIPGGFVITADAYRYVVDSYKLYDHIHELLADLDRDSCSELQCIEPRIRELFTAIDIPPDLQERLLEDYMRLGDNVPVAVRSSATAEDLADASFAGQQETFLNVIGQAELLDAVRRCWSSLFTSQAIFYRRCRGFDDESVSMAVVVQQMIQSAKSGVSFTVEPVMGNRRQMVIEGVWGLGEGIVSGTITPDHYKVDKRTYEIAFEFIPAKEIMFCRGERGGVACVAVPPDQVSARVLTEDELRQLVDLGNLVEEHFGCPQDIEWGIENGEIYLLQSRPITCL
jgi:pyruvate,water dikinase